MAQKPKQVLYRRKREQRTNYNKRLKLLLSSKPRLVVRFSNKQIRAQLVTFMPNHDHIVYALDSSSLRKFGWSYSLNNLPAAYLLGLLFGKNVLQKGQMEAVMDTGFLHPLSGGKLYAFVKGVIDAGLQVPMGEGIFPSEERIMGKHIAAFAMKLKSDNKELYDQRFAQYLKSKQAPEQVPVVFASVKKKIMGSLR